MNAMKTAYLAAEGDLNAAIDNLSALARLVAERDDEFSNGIAGMMFDQIDRLKRVQDTFDDAHENGGGA